MCGVLSERALCPQQGLLMESNAVTTFWYITTLAHFGISLYNALGQC